MKKNMSFMSRIVGATLIFFGGQVFADTKKEVVINIIGVENFSREHCVVIPANQKITYEFESPIPVDFDIHFHTETDTGYKANKRNIHKLAADFSTDSQQHYCFTWTNKPERGGEWDINFRYQISSK